MPPRAARKLCGSPGCTLLDFHEGLCSNAMVESTRKRSPSASPAGSPYFADVTKEATRKSEEGASASRVGSLSAKRLSMGQGSVQKSATKKAPPKKKRKTVPESDESDKSDGEYKPSDGTSSEGDQVGHTLPARQLLRFLAPLFSS